MKNRNDILGILCIIFGILLFVSVTNFLFLQLLAAFIAYKIIDFGFALRGMPPISFYVRHWLRGQGF